MIGRGLGRVPAGAVLMIVAAVVLATAGGAGRAAAQGFDFATRGDLPIEVLADNGIEWEQGTQRLIARGQAKAIRGDVTVHADTLIAHYRDVNGSTEIWKLDATGRVHIASPTENAYGDTAEYSVDDARLTLRGAPARLVTLKETVTARDGIDYFEKKRQAVARGDVVATSADGRRLRADTMTATLTPAGAPKTEIKRITANGNVEIETAAEVVRGDTGAYNLETGIATLSGSVKITRGENQMNGGYAEVNTKTGVSRLLSRAAGQSKGGREQVEVLVVPGKKDGPGGKKDGPGGKKDGPGGKKDGPGDRKGGPAGLPAGARGDGRGTGAASGR